MHRLYHEVTNLMRHVAATVVMPRFRTLAADEIMEKTPGDLVTIADHESEVQLGEGLLAMLPEARVIGEEAAAADPAILEGLANGIVWIIDPVDGTMNFAEGKSPFAIMIGLAINGVREAGWILDPVTGRLCHAARGIGAFVDGERIMAKPSNGPLPKAAIATYFLPEDRRADIEQRAAGKIDIVAIPRCAGEQYPRLVLGENDIALFERTHVWDHAPGALFLEESGGKIARPDGSPYRIGVPGKGMIGAASPELWDEAARILFD